MKRFVSGFLSFVMAMYAIAGVSLFGEPDANPYVKIIERNVFGLREPPPPAPQTPPQAQNPNNIKISGISNYQGKKRAHFVIQENPGKTPPFRYLTLNEKMKEDEIEVISINEKEGSVKVLISGIERTLTLGVDSPQKPVGPAPNQLPNTPAALPGANVPGMVRPMAVVPPQMPPPVAVSPQTMVQTPNIAPISAQPQSSQVQPLQNQSSSASITRRIRSRADNVDLNQMLQIELNREETRGEVLAGRMPPLPPTPLSQDH